MRKIIFLLGFALCSVYSLAQNAIKIGAKINASSLSTNMDFDLFNQNKWTVNPSIGIDYLSHKSYYLNSEIALVTIGGKDAVLTSDEVSPSQKIEVSWKYVEANTKFRLQYPFANMSLYAGAGMYVRFRTSSSLCTVIDKDMIEDQDFAIMGRKFLYGEIFECGITTTQGKLKADFNVYYYLRNNHIAQYGYTKLYPNTWGLGFSIGYVL